MSIITGRCPITWTRSTTSRCRSAARTAAGVRSRTNTPASSSSTRFRAGPSCGGSTFTSGTCTACGRRVQGRHELQTSDALGAAAVQLGADAHAALAILNKEFGLSHGKSASAFERLFGLKINRSTSVRSILRTARRLEPAEAEIRDHVRGFAADHL